MSAAYQSYPDRQRFAAQMSHIRDDDSKRAVEGLIGRPDDIWRDPDPVAAGGEIWCYGTVEHLSLPTLGQVWFRHGRVVWVAGGHGAETVPPASLIAEAELRAAMRFMHPAPDRAAHRDPLHLIRVTNMLQPLGKQKALAIIGEYVRVAGWHAGEIWLFLLLRTLFEVPSPPGHMPDMHIGAMVPPPPGDRTRIPRFPIVIVEDIPFSLFVGALCGGLPEPVAFHMGQFRAHGALRSRLLSPPDDPYPAFRRLLVSSEWACMVEAVGDTRGLRDLETRTLLEVLVLARTAYEPPEVRQPFAYPDPADYDRYHAAFSAMGARWDSLLQMYVRGDGSHGAVGQLVNTS